MNRKQFQLQLLQSPPTRKALFPVEQFALKAILSLPMFLKDRPLYTLIAPAAL